MLSPRMSRGPGTTTPSASDPTILSDGRPCGAVTVTTSTSTAAALAGLPNLTKAAVACRFMPAGNVEYPHAEPIACAMCFKYRVPGRLPDRPLHQSLSLLMMIDSCSSSANLPPMAHGIPTPPTARRRHHGPRVGTLQDCGGDGRTIIPQIAAVYLDLHCRYLGHIALPLVRQPPSST